MDQKQINELRAEELIQALCDDLITPEQLIELEELVCSDQQIRRFYIRSIHLQTGLHRYALSMDVAPDDVVSESDVDAETTSLSDKVTLTPEPKSSSPVLGFIVNRWRASVQMISTPTRLSLLIASITMISLITTLAILAVPHYWNAEETNDLAEENLHPEVALISQTANCVWSTDEEDDLTNAGKGRKIRSGDALHLKQGHAKVRFFSGAEVLLTAPARLTIHSNNSGYLQHGQISAVVPQKAYGFQISTSAAAIRDLGTEFAVMSEKNGDTEVHVFLGSVEVKSKPEGDETPRKKILVAGDSIRISKKYEHAFCEPQMTEEQFTKVLPAEDLDLPVTFGLHVWLSADFGVSRLPNGEVLSWRDQSNARRMFVPTYEVQSNNPTLIKDSKTGLPLMHFDGQGDMFSSKKSFQLFRTGTSRLTTFVVFRTENNNGKKIVIGHSHDVKKYPNDHFQLGYDVGQNIGKGNFGLHRGSGSATIAPASTIQNGQMQLMSTVVVSSAQVPDNVAIYKNGKQLSPVIADGRMAPGWLEPGKYNTEKSILDIGGRNDYGKREIFDSFHQGDIAEVIIYRRDLSNREREQMEAYLMKKWNLTN